MPENSDTDRVEELAKRVDELESHLEDDDQSDNSRPSRRGFLGMLAASAGLGAAGVYGLSGQSSAATAQGYTKTGELRDGNDATLATLNNGGPFAFQVPVTAPSVDAGELSNSLIFASNYADMQTAVNAAPEGGWVVLEPNTTYDIDKSAPVVVDKSLRIGGPGTAAGTATTSAPVLSLSDTDGDDAFQVQAGGVRFSDCIIDGPTATLGANTGNAINVPGQKRGALRVQRVGITNFGGGACINAPYQIFDGRIEDCNLRSSKWIIHGGPNNSGQFRDMDIHDIRSFNGSRKPRKGIYLEGGANKCSISHLQFSSFEEEGVLINGSSVANMFEHLSLNEANQSNGSFHTIRALGPQSDTTWREVQANQNPDTSKGVFIGDAGDTNRRNVFKQIDCDGRVRILGQYESEITAIDAGEQIRPDTWQNCDVGVLRAGGRVLWRGPIVDSMPDNVESNTYPQGDDPTTEFGLTTNGSGELVVSVYGGVFEFTDLPEVDINVTARANVPSGESGPVVADVAGNDTDSSGNIDEVVVSLEWTDGTTPGSSDVTADVALEP